MTFFVDVLKTWLVEQAASSLTPTGKRVWGSEQQRARCTRSARHDPVHGRAARCDHAEKFAMVVGEVYGAGAATSTVDGPGGRRREALRPPRRNGAERPVTRVYLLDRPP